MGKTSDKWCKARNGMNPCERCKEFIEPGDWYWGTSAFRHCYVCAPGIATCDPPELAYILAKWSPVQQKYWVTARAWGGGPINPPCEKPCPDFAGDISSCPFRSCPMQQGHASCFAG